MLPSEESLDATADANDSYYRNFLAVEASMRPSARAWWGSNQAGASEGVRKLGNRLGDVLDLILQAGMEEDWNHVFMASVTLCEVLYGYGLVARDPPMGYAYLDALDADANQIIPAARFKELSYMMGALNKFKSAGRGRGRGYDRGGGRGGRGRGRGGRGGDGGSGTAATAT